MRYEVLASLEKHWAAADQDPFIAAVILNPFLHADFLARRHIALTNRVMQYAEASTLLCVQNGCGH